MKTDMTARAKGKSRKKQDVPNCSTALAMVLITGIDLRDVMARLIRHHGVEAVKMAIETVNASHTDEGMENHGVCL